MEQKTKIIAEEGKQELFITREFDLPVDLLFQAYTQSEIIEQWMGTKVLKLDNKSHGSYQFETTHNGNVVFKANGTIHKIVLNESIVRTFEIEDMSIGVQLEFLEFKKLTETASKLDIHIIYKSVERRERQLKMPFAYGLNMAHNQLQSIAEKIRVNDKEK